MAHVYTPGLKVAYSTIIRRERRLPLPGEVVVKVGDSVKAETVVAKTHLPGSVQVVNIANALSVPAKDLVEYLLKKEGESVEKDELLAATKGFFGWFKSEVRASASGTIESVSGITGQLLIREAPIPIEINAYIDGAVVEMLPSEGSEGSGVGVIVETQATFIQGIFGIGGEMTGEIAIAVNQPDEPLTPGKLNSDMSDKVVVGGSWVAYESIKKAVQIGIKGVIVGGIDDSDLRNFLGHDIGVAITGSERLGLTLILTEGFGEIKMADRTFDLLKKRQGSKASINGATQIRAGVMRPEIIIPVIPVIPVADEKFGLNRLAANQTPLEVGTIIRAIREPYFGRLGKVSAFPIQLQKLETEALVRVLEVEFENGDWAILPRANVEVIETDEN